MFPSRSLQSSVVILSGLFALSYGIAPLYYSNQNQYFLHGLAAAGVGNLADDWLAGTADPTPVFSALVRFTAQYLHPWMFYVYHALALATYAAAIFGLFAAVAGPRAAQRCWPFAALFLLSHSAMARGLSYRFFGFDYPWFLQAGVAGQYILGAMLQPSVSGVLLVVAICLFVRGRPLVASACAGAVGGLHSTYLLPAAMITLGFLAALLVERRLRTAVLSGFIALGLALPVAVFIVLRFGPTDAETFAKAQDILVNVRIPHHARPDLWIDTVSALQIAWIALAVLLAGLTFATSQAITLTPTPTTTPTPTQFWASRIFPVLLVPFLLAVALTLLQVATGSHTLALLFPWRVSAVLLPVATAVVFSRVACLPWLGSGIGMQFASALVVAALVGGGIWVMADRQAFQSDPAELPVLDFVHQTHSPGDVYLIPVEIPDLVKKTRGSLSSDFKPLLAKKADPTIIPVGLQRFRLHTGAAIYIDFKSIPYKDREVVLWYSRLQQAADFQRRIRANSINDILPELSRRGITHLVWPATRPLDAPKLVEIHKDAVYRVYRIQDPAE